MSTTLFASIVKGNPRSTNFINPRIPNCAYICVGGAI